MASFDSLAEEYALKIRNSVKRKGSTKLASFLIESTLDRNYVELLMEINSDISKYLVGGCVESDQFGSFDLNK